MSSTYVAALALLARRELSEAQLRQRLLRKGHQPEEVEEAIVRLREERAVDDRRVAEAIARTAVTVKRRGRLRVEREIQRAGIAPEIARHALDGVFETLSDDELLESALARRLRGRTISDQREFSRLYRYLLGQGFESDRIVAALNRHRTGAAQ